MITTISPPVANHFRLKMSIPKDGKNTKKQHKNVHAPKKETRCKFMKLKLHQLLDEAEITELHELFDKKAGRRMDRAELREALEECGSLKYTDANYDLIFKQMNSSWFVI